MKPKKSHGGLQQWKGNADREMRLERKLEEQGDKPGRRVHWVFLRLGEGGGDKRRISSLQRIDRSGKRGTSVRGE